MLTCTLLSCEKIAKQEAVRARGVLRNNGGGGGRTKSSYRKYNSPLNLNLLLKNKIFIFFRLPMTAGE
jgi:hypothetical protein